MTKKANIWVQVGKLGLHSAKINGYDGYITVGRFAQANEGKGIRVTAYGPDRCPYTGYRTMVHIDLVRGREVFDSMAVNNLGQPGAYVTKEPDTSLVQGAINWARIVIEGLPKAEQVAAAPDEVQVSL